MPQSTKPTNTSAAEVANFIEQVTTRALAKPGIRLTVPNTAVLGLIKNALKGIDLIPESANKNVLALHTLAQQVIALGVAVEHGLSDSLQTASPAGIAEAQQTLPKNRIAPNTTMGIVNSQMPGEGVGEEIPVNTRSNAGSVSETPGTPDEDTSSSVEQFPAEPNIASPVPTMSGLTSPSSATSPQTTPLGNQAEPAFNYADSPEQRQQDMQKFANKTFQEQLAGQPTTATVTPNPANPVGDSSAQSNNQLNGSTAQSPDHTTSNNLAKPETQPVPTNSTKQPGDDAQPSKSTPGIDAVSGGQATQPVGTNKQNEQVSEASRFRQVLNTMRRRKQIKSVNKNIQEMEKKVRDLTFNFSTEYLLIVCFKEGTDFILSILSLTGFLASIASLFSITCITAQGIIIWWQTKLWRKEVFDNKRALQAIVAMLVEIIPIINILPINIVNAMALFAQSERAQKKYRNKLDQLQKQHHKLVNAKTL